MSTYGIKRELTIPLCFCRRNKNRLLLASSENSKVSPGVFAESKTGSAVAAPQQLFSRKKPKELHYLLSSMPSALLVLAALFIATLESSAASPGFFAKY